MVVCSLRPPVTYIRHLFQCFPSPPSAVPPLAPYPQPTPVCDVPLPVSMCSHCSTPAYESEHVVFGFLFLCQFAENGGLQIHSCPYKGMNSLFFMAA